MTEPNDDGLTRVTVNLSPRAMQALRDLRSIAEFRGVDAINRALILYGEVLHAALEPERWIEIDLFGDGRTYKIKPKALRTPQRR